MGEYKMIIIYVIIVQLLIFIITFIDVKVHNKTIAGALLTNELIAISGALIVYGFDL